MIKMKTLAFLLISLSGYAQITLFGVASNPADGGSLAASTVAVTPPSSMQAGDLVVVYLHQRGTATITQSVTGGQTWTATAVKYQVNTTNTIRSFYCVFNGTWDANPSWAFTATNSTTAVMLVFRPDGGTSSDWGVANAISYATPATAATVTVTGITPTENNNVTIAQWASNDDNTWGTLTGSGWVKTGLGDQYRNLAGTDLSMTFAYQVQSTAAATGNVSQTQLTLGNDQTGVSTISFYEIGGSPYVSPIKNRIVNE
jgi:hypothetical protein